jgi:predicted phosphoribosyltransferase
VVGGEDPTVLELNRSALAALRCEKELAIVPGATHLFEEPGALEEVMALAVRWFGEHLAPGATERVFRDREQAGERLAEALGRFKGSDPVVLALPRGGVPVAFEIARSLEAPLDLVLVRKIGAPFQPELAVAAVVDGEKMEITVNEDLIEALRLPEGYVQEQAARQVEEIERRRELYLRGRDRVGVEGRTAILVDDGIATGASMRAALRAVRRRQPGRLVLAVPVAPPATVAALREEADEVVCLSTPPYFGAIGQFYADFRQLGDDEVRELLERAAAWRPKPVAPGAA